MSLKRLIEKEIANIQRDDWADVVSIDLLENNWSAYDCQEAWDEVYKKSIFKNVACRVCYSRLYKTHTMMKIANLNEIKNTEFSPGQIVMEKD